MFSLTIDYDNSTPVSVAGYAKLWGWSRNKVTWFFDEIGIKIEYPENTSKKQNQNGQITRQIMDRSENKNGQIRIIDFNNLHTNMDRSENKNGQIMDRSMDTTREPSIILDPKRTPPISPPRGKRSRLPDDFTLTEKQIQYAVDNNIDPLKVDKLCDAFKDYHIGKGNIMSDWNRAWQTYVRNAPQFSQWAMAKGKDDAGRKFLERVRATKDVVSENKSF
jgi:hypothetical protein